MPEIGDDDLEYADRIAASADVHRSAWQETLDDMKAMAEELEEDGWAVHSVAAGHTAPKSPNTGRRDDDQWGLTHVVPDNFAEEFEEFFERGDYPRYDVYRQEMEGRVFFLTVLMDPDSESAILIAAHYEMMHAGPMVHTAKEEGKMLTNVQTLDGTHLGSFEHDEPSKFVPHYEDFDERYDPRAFDEEELQAAPEDVQAEGVEPAEGTSLEDADLEDADTSADYELDEE